MSIHKHSGLCTSDHNLLNIITNNELIGTNNLVSGEVEQPIALHG